MGGSAGVCADEAADAAGFEGGCVAQAASSVSNAAPAETRRRDVRVT
jgi:hypothetical protein